MDKPLGLFLQDELLRTRLRAHKELFDKRFLGLDMRHDFANGFASHFAVALQTILIEVPLQSHVGKRILFGDFMEFATPFETVAQLDLLRDISDILTNLEENRVLENLAKRPGHAFLAVLLLLFFNVFLTNRSQCFFKHRGLDRAVLGRDNEADLGRNCRKPLGCTDLFHLLELVL